VGVFAGAAVGGHIEISKSLYNNAGVRGNFGNQEKPVIVQTASNGYVGALKVLLKDDLSSLYTR